MTRHAIARARERYGVELSEDDLAALEEDIREGRSLLMGWETRKRWKERHVVRLGGHYLLAAWDRATEKIFTFLPADNMQPGAATRGYQAAAKKAGRNPNRRRRKRNRRHGKHEPGFRRAGNKKPPPPALW